MNSWEKLNQTYNQYYNEQHKTVTVRKFFKLSTRFFLKIIYAWECELTNVHKCAQTSNKLVICMQRFQLRVLFGAPVTQFKEHISTFTAWLFQVRTFPSKEGGRGSQESVCSQTDISNTLSFLQSFYFERYLNNFVCYWQPLKHLSEIYWKPELLHNIGV